MNRFQKACSDVKKKHLEYNKPQPTASEWDEKSWDITIQYAGVTALSIRTDGVMDCYDRDALAAYVNNAAVSMQPPALGGEPEVKTLATTTRWFVGHWEAQDPSQWGWHVGVTGLSANLPEGIELVDRAHIDRLQTEVERNESYVRGQRKSLDICAEQIENLQALNAALEGRLHKATAFVQGMRDAAGSQPSVATGYLQDILDELSSAGGAKS